MAGVGGFPLPAARSPLQEKFTYELSSRHPDLFLVAWEEDEAEERKEKKERFTVKVAQDQCEV